jgi:hypothetical protein
MRRFLLALLAASAALSLGPGAALADRGRDGHCPPGLAKKNPPCVPPGLARRGGSDHGNDWRDDDWRDDDWRDDDWRDDDWRDGDYRDGYQDGYRDGYRIAVGDILREGDYRLVRNPPLFGLPAYGPDAWRYYLVRDMIVRADPGTRRVLAVVGLVDALLN